MELFAWYGAAMYAAQLFEVELVTLLLNVQRLADSEVTLEKLNKMDDALSRKTLGALLNELKKRTSLHPDFEQLLMSYRDKRNYLAHGFFFENAQKMSNLEGFKKLTKELQQTERQLREADAIAMKMSENVRREIGIPEHEFNAYVSRLMKAERAGNNAT
jgi:ERCC4-type nuclease